MERIVFGVYTWSLGCVWPYANHLASLTCRLTTCQINTSCIIGLCEGQLRECKRVLLVISTIRIVTSKIPQRLSGSGSFVTFAILVFTMLTSAYQAVLFVKDYT